MMALATIYPVCLPSQEEEDDGDDDDEDDDDRSIHVG